MASKGYMRISVLILSFLLTYVSQAQTTYYSKSTITTFSTLADWGTSPDGTGTAPGSISSTDHFVVRNGALITSLGSGISVNNLTIESGSLLINQTLTIAGNLVVSGGAITTSDGSARETTVAGNVTISGGTFTMGAGVATLRFVTSGTVSLSSNVAGLNWNIQVDAAATVNLIANLQIPSGITMNVLGRLNLTADMGGNSYLVSGAGTFTLAVDATLGIAHTATHVVVDNASTGLIRTNTRTFTIASIISLNGTGNQTLDVANYPTNARLYTAGSGTKSINGNLVFANQAAMSSSTRSTLMVASGTTFSDAGFSLTFQNTTNATGTDLTVDVAGSYSSTGSGSIIFSSNVGGGGIRAVTGTTFGDLILTIISATNPIGLMSPAGTSNFSFRNITYSGVGASGSTFIPIRLNATNITSVTVNQNISNSPSSIANAGFQFSGATSGGTITLLGDLNSTSSSTSFSILANNATSPVFVFGGSSVQNISLGGNSTLFGSNAQMTLNNASGIALIGTRTITISGTIRVTSGTVTPGTSTWAYNSATILEFNGSAIQNTNSNIFPSTTISTLRINNAAGVVLHTARSVSNLDLVLGLLTTTTTNLLTVTGTGVSSVTFPFDGSSYVNGPLTRRMPTALGVPSNYVWPVGKSLYTPFTMANLTISFGFSTPAIRVEAFDANSGGTAGTGFTSLNTNRYWSVNSSGSLFITTMVPALFQPGLSSTDAIGFSTTLAGTYNSLGGNIISGILTSNSNQTTIAGFYNIGTKINLNAGTYTIGPGGNYSNLSAVAVAIRNANVTGPVTFEFNASYVGASHETSFPIIFYPTSYSGIGAPHTITIRPAAGAGAKTISGSSSTPLIDIFGLDKLVIDGRQGGVGTTRSLEISNTNTTTGTIRFGNDAQYDTLRYINLRGRAPAGQAVVVLASGASNAGNDGIGIMNNRIYDGSSTPIVGIISTNDLAGSSNDSVYIAANEIFNFFSAGAASSGINITSNASAWRIEGNHFYQTASRTNTANNINSAIAISTAGVGVGFVIDNNFIGGTAPACGGTAWTISGATSHRFRAIDISSVGTSTQTIIRGNKISNFNFTTNSTATGIPGIFCGINATVGNVRIGGVIPAEGNIIGATTGLDSIIITANANAAASSAIASSSTDVANIYYNQIGAVTVLGSSASINHGLRSIWLTNAASPLNIYGNIIGNTTANNIRANTASTEITNPQYLTGIWSTAAVQTIVDSNTVQNFTSAYIPASAIAGNFHIAGIILQGVANHTIQRSLIRNLAMAANYSGTGTNSPGIVGIFLNVPGGVHAVSRNIIHSLSNSNTNQTAVVGIFFNSASLGIVSRNFVHSLSTSSTSASGMIDGIRILGGTSVVHNNMVRLGKASDGSDVTMVGVINGIVESTSTANYYFNSVHLNGSTNSTTRSYAFNSNVTTNVRIIRNNIFSVTRTNAGIGRNYAVTVGGTAANPAGLTINNNLYFVSGTGTVLGRFNNADVATLQAWRVNVGQDVNSGVGNPNFVNPDADALAVSLKVQSPTPAEGVGVAIASYDTEDFEGEVRDAFGPVDIGADAGNYTLSDAYTPIIGTITPLTNTASNANRTITIQLTDVGTGIATSGTTRPTIWFRRSAPSASAWASTYGVLNSGNANNGQWEFTINYAALSLTPTNGETYQYYFVVQDQATTPNIWFSNVAATTPVHPDVNTQTTAPATPLNYTILPGVPTLVTVGVGGSYSSLTGAAGLFNAINGSSLTGNTTVKVVSNLSEDGNTALLNTGMSGYSLTIVPHDTSTVEKSIIMTTTTQPMIRLYGVSGVTIDGRLSGSGQNLRLRSENATPGNIRPIVQINLGSSNITVRNCILESQTTNSTDTLTGMINLGATGSNSTINIVANTFRNYSGATTRNRFVIYSLNGASNNNVTIGGATAADGNTFQDVAISSFGGYFVQTVTSMGTGWVIRNNTFNFNINTALTSGIGQTVSAVNLAGGGNHTISNNTIRYTASASNNANYVPIWLTGTSVGNSIDWNNFDFNASTYSSQAVTCIQMEAAGMGTNNIRNNRIYRSGTSTTIAATTFNGILANTSNTSNLVITGNRIGGTDSTTSGVLLAASGTFSGINLSPETTTTHSVQGNRIEAISLTSTSATQNLINLVSANFNVGNLEGNVIGSSGKPILSNSNLIGILSNATGSHTVVISNNNLSYFSVNATTQVSLMGLRTEGSAVCSVSNNSIDSLTYMGAHSVTLDLASQFVPLGIDNTSGGVVTISQNQISRISLSTNLANSAWIAFGIRSNGGNTGSTITRNRIYDLTTTRTGTGSNAPIVQGIYVTSFTGTVSNNQLSIINSIASTQPLITGINVGSTNNVNVWNNSVVIGGTAAGTNSTYAFQRTVTSGTHSYRNNILLNERSGSGSHFAIGTTSATGWGSVTSSNNVLISSSASAIGEYATGTSRTFSEWVTSASESNSISTQSGAVSAASMFSGLSTGDLSTNHCMAAYGGAAGLASVDYAGATRNTPTSIGSTEITSVSTPGLWTGRSSTNSATALNWCGNAVPSSGTAVDIASYAVNQPTLTAALSTGNVTIPSGATLTAAANIITPSASSVVSITGTVNTENALGLSDNVNATFSSTNSPTINVNSGSTINYNAITTQTVTSLAYHNLTINGGVSKNMGGNVTVNGTLNLNSGSLDVLSNTLTLNGVITTSASNAIGGNGSSNLVIGSASSGNPFFRSSVNAFNNLTFNRSTTLGNAVEVRGVLTASSGTLTTGGFLTMGSGATYQGMVDFSGAGSVSGNVIAQRYISGINDAWRGFSAPVAATYSDISATVDLGTQGVNGSNLITLRDMDFWTGANWQKASNWRIAADTNINAIPAGIITAGRGFLAYGGTAGIANLSSPVTLDLTGSLNSSMISAPGLVSSNRAYNGWMLMGNPYLATLDWESMYGTADVANLNATIYLYNTTYGSWDSYNAVTNTTTGSGTNLIAPFQAFMVKASNATVPTLNFRTSQTSTSASTYNFRQNNLFPIVRLNVKKNNVQVQTALTLIAAQATDGLDADYDAQYPGSFNGHNFYSMTTGDYKLQQNSRPMPTTGISEPYFFEYNGTGNYSIAPSLENIDPTWTVMLEDKITGTMHNLRTASYNFAHQATNRKDRFVLHLNAMTTAVNEVADNSAPIVAMQNGTLNVRFAGMAASRKLEVVDLSGKVLRTIMMENATAAEIDLSDFAQAVYLLRATGNGTTSVTKFVNAR